MIFLLPILIVFAISILGLVGGILLIYKQSWAKFISTYAITFAIGAMLAVVFFDLLPEAITSIQSVENVLLYTLVGMIGFYILEKTLLWYHHHSIEQIWHRTHTSEEKIHHVGYMITLGDSLHNFIDGVVIAAGFLVDFNLGIATSLAVLLHEIPEEIGVFAVLLHSGFGKSKTIWYSLFAQMAAVIGAVVGFLYLPLFDNLKTVILALAAGGFIYIAVADLLPETHREKSLSKSLIQIGLMIFGIVLIWYIGKILPA